MSEILQEPAASGTHAISPLDSSRNLQDNRPIDRMPLRFYNTLSRATEEFAPLRPGRVSVYACGPTVYRAPHVGNYRSFVLYDTLHRWLEWKGFDVRFVMNLTDVEDKIIKSAADSGVSIGEITEPLIDSFFKDLDALAIRRADAYPRATHHIADMIALIHRLIANGHAYVSDGSVYFDISSFPAYGRLSRIDFEGIKAGAGLSSRSAAIDADEYEKEDARDFALWKAAKDVDRQTGAAWPTPWGEGRPGWHIECSAMSMKELGETFDIHLGGEDLVFPHHEDEIAQSEGATGKPFVRVWLHVTHLKVNGEKMSKSKQNDYRLDQILDMGHSAAAVRYVYLTSHYRSELNFSLEALGAAQTAVQRLMDFRRRLDETPASAAAPESDLPAAAARALGAFEEAMDDDLNTPRALGALFPFVGEVHAALDRVTSPRPEELARVHDALNRMDDVLGLVELALRDVARISPDLAAWVEQKAQERETARRRRDWAAADSIRKEILDAGFVVEDTPAGPRWRKR
jgi:cysteinyl-tRNA synthetase